LRLPFSKNTLILILVYPGTDAPILEISGFFDTWSINQAIFTGSGVPVQGALDAS
jgi:hypothetical protein